MNAITSSELQKGGPITADVAAFAEMPPAPQEVKRDLNEAALDTRNSEVMTEARQLAPLFVPEVAQEFRSRWDTVQRGFVDDPRQAVRQGDELVGLVMKSLAETFSQERATLEGQLDQADKASTETLRIALRRYRSFFERLLAF
jgi:hypothetical protein